MLRYQHIHFTSLHSSPLWQNSHWKSRFDTKNLGNEGDIKEEKNTERRERASTYVRVQKLRKNWSK